MCVFGFSVLILFKRELQIYFRRELKFLINEGAYNLALTP